MRLLVIGTGGQVARSLNEAGKAAGVDVLSVGRPHLDLLDQGSIEHAIARADASIVINAAAYTAVDRAESEPDLAFALNSDAVECVGRICAARDIATLHLSTDYVFDGRNAKAYTEEDATAPLGVYGQSKLAGEERLRAVNPRHIIVRTAWVFSPFGSNFLKTMLRLGGERRQLSIVDDQLGNPTFAPHLAEILLALAARVVSAPAHDLWGTYHAAGSGEATWYAFAGAIFKEGRQHGFSAPELIPITTAEYPTAASRPANSRMDCSRLKRKFGLELPHWHLGLAACLDRLAAAGPADVPRP